MVDAGVLQPVVHLTCSIILNRRELPAQDIIFPRHTDNEVSSSVGNSHTDQSGKPPRKATISTPQFLVTADHLVQSMLNFVSIEKNTGRNRWTHNHSLTAFAASQSWKSSAQKWIALTHRSLSSFCIQ